MDALCQGSAFCGGSLWMLCGGSLGRLSGEALCGGSEETPCGPPHPAGKLSASKLLEIFNFHFGTVQGCSHMAQPARARSRSRSRQRPRDDETCFDCGGRPIEGMRWRPGQNHRGVRQALVCGVCVRMDLLFDVRRRYLDDPQAEEIIKTGLSQIIDDVSVHSDGVEFRRSLEGDPI